MWNHAQDAYLESRVLSADPVELIRLLYQTGVSAVQDARRAWRWKNHGAVPGDYQGGRVLIQLITALDHERGGEISRRLAALYDYMLRRLTRPTPGSATNRWPRC